MSTTRESAELQRLAAMMRACSPARAARPGDPAAQIAAIEQRSAAITRRRRLLRSGAISAALVVALAAALIVEAPTRDRRAPAPAVASAPVPAVASAPVAARAAGSSTQRRPLRSNALTDLGVARVLLRPGARASYEPGARTLHLSRGEAVLHVLPDGRGFLVELARQTVEVKGTLFRVDADRGEVHVWHGTVELRDRRGRVQAARLIHGTEAYDDLPAARMKQLGFAPPPKAKKITGRRSRHRARRPGGVAVVSRETSDAGVDAGKQPDAGTSAPATQRAKVQGQQERQLLLGAQRALASRRWRQALAGLRSHQRRYPSSIFAEEVSLLLQRALIGLVAYRELAAEADRFLRRFPRSVHAPRVRRLRTRARQQLQRK